MAWGRRSNFRLNLGIKVYPFPLDKGRSPEASGWRSGEWRLRAWADVAHALGSLGAPSAGIRTGRQELAEKGPTGRKSNRPRYKRGPKFKTP